ncbi:hypothetical protein MAMP_00274 [Methylophaga aminisulfidivorans MP]|uniref:DarT domain-containing protein n=1 Tax=Methylophaga aminisulfidivorans MP TaxID=1026882 RepID=F5T1I5_9GAMM|nr:DarT ssDNA thymidine ADP-ribosyltransferase family protein [Methylophaga aminisulfidivorans]EGL53081.1 hypothetical protein MAMP_00274 [Methylophaga aminisulfidivorans MP]
METVLIWQTVITASIVLSRLHSKVLMIVVALCWTGWTILALQTSPLFVLQLISTWGTVWIISWCSGLFGKPDKKNDNSTLKTEIRPQHDVVESESESDNALNKIGTTINKGLFQFSETLDRVNDNLKKEAEKDKLNQNFLLELYAFRLSVDHAIKNAEAAYQSDHLYENEPEKRKLYEQTRIQISNSLKELNAEGVEERKIELSTIPLVHFAADISHSPLALNQRIEKVQECLNYVAQVEKRISEERSLLEYIDKVIDKKPFISFLTFNKWSLSGHLRKLNSEERHKERVSHKSSTFLSQTVSTDVILQTDGRLPKAELYKEKIKGIVEKRNINYLVHFTRIENLPKILENGLKSRTSLQLDGVGGLMNDTLRLDNVNDAISTSISFPNYKMFYRKQIQFPHADWAVIKLEPSILWELDCAFCYSNAAGKASTKLTLDARRSAAAFEKMFDENLGNTVRQSLKIPDNYPTDPQAEVLVLEGISPKYIQSICLNQKTEMHNLSQVQETIKPYLNMFKFFHEPMMFLPRKDYDSWGPVKLGDYGLVKGNPYTPDDFQF